MHEKPKLSMMEQIAECGIESSCAGLKSKDERRMMLKLRGVTEAFQIEMGRWHGVKREERVCKECNSGEVEDVGHCNWLLQCSAWDDFRKPLLAEMDAVREDFARQNDKDKAALILSIACRNYVYCLLLTLCGQLYIGFIKCISVNTLCNLSSKLLTVITPILILIFITCVYYSAAWDHMVS